MTLLERAAGVAGRLLVIGLALAALLWVLAQVLVVVVPVVLAVFLTALLWPLARRLRDRGLNRALSTTAVCLLAIGVLALAVRLLGPQGRSAARPAPAGPRHRRSRSPARW